MPLSLPSAPSAMLHWQHMEPAATQTALTTECEWHQWTKNQLFHQFQSLGAITQIMGARAANY